jgi:hypothetical protein
MCGAQHAKEPEKPNPVELALYDGADRARASQPVSIGKIA